MIAAASSSLKMSQETLIKNGNESLYK